MTNSKRNMVNLLSDGPLRSVLRNSSYLGVAKIAGAPLGIVALACATRELAPTLFGLLIVIHAYATGASELTKFQSWQLIIRYGGRALTLGNKEVVQHAIRFAFALDIVSGIVGMLGAIALLPLLSDRLALSGSTLLLAAAYCTLIPFMTSATPSGVLRLCNRFDLLAVQQLATPSLRAIGASVSLVSHFGFPGLIATWYVADLGGDLLLWMFAARELRRRDMSNALRPRLFGLTQHLPDAWSFAWTTNIGHSVYAAWGSISSVVVAAVLGPAAAGLYKIAQTVIDSAGKPADFLNRGFYPEIMRLDPASAAPWRLAARTAFLAALIGMLMLATILLGGEPLIKLVFGHKYLASAPLLQLMIWAIPVTMAMFPLESLLFMVGRQRAALVAQSAATVIYLALLASLGRAMGLFGTGVAFLLGTAVMASFMLVPVLGSYRRRDQLEDDELAPTAAD